MHILMNLHLEVQCFHFVSKSGKCWLLDYHIVAWWCRTATKHLVNICSGNGLLPDGTKPIPDPKLIKLIIISEVFLVSTQGLKDMLKISILDTWWRHQMETFSALLSPVNSPHKGQWRGALMFSLICVWINVWINNRKAGDLRRYHAHYDVIVMYEFANY